MHIIPFERYMFKQGSGRGVLCNYLDSNIKLLIKPRLKTCDDIGRSHGDQTKLYVPGSIPSRSGRYEVSSLGNTN